MVYKSFVKHNQQTTLIIVLSKNTFLYIILKFNVENVSLQKNIKTLLRG